MIDYHIHTPLCNHAKGSIENYIQFAILKGFKEICFLDHFTMDPMGQGHSMQAQEVPLYFYAVQKFKKKYQSQITIKCGLEVDFAEDYIEKSLEVIERFNFDVVSSSVHFVKGFNVASVSTFQKKPDLDLDAIYLHYIKKMDKMLAYDYYDVVCHLDVVKKCGLKPSRNYDQEFRKILDKIKQKNCVLEINTGGLLHPAKAIYPDWELIKYAFEKNISIILGSDSHVPENIGNGFLPTLNQLKNMGFHHVCSFDQRKKKTRAIGDLVLESELSGN